MWRGRPAAPLAASVIASEMVGWGAMVRARSSTVAPISTARAAAKASSATPGPDQVDAENGAVPGFGHDFDVAADAAEGHGPARGGQGEAEGGDLGAGLGGLFGGEADGGHLRVGEDDGRDGGGIEGGRAAGGGESGHLGFGGGLVGQGRAGRDVADGVDAFGRPAGRVDGDQTGGVEPDPGLLQAEGVGVGPPADGHHYGIGRQAAFAFGAFHHQVVAVEAQRFGAEVQADAPVPQGPLHHPGESWRHAGEEPVGELDQGDIGAQLGEGGAQLHADVAGADHHQPAGDAVEGEGAGRVEHAPAVEGQLGQLDGA